MDSSQRLKVQQGDFIRAGGLYDWYKEQTGHPYTTWYLRPGEDRRDPFVDWWEHLYEYVYICKVPEVCEGYLKNRILPLRKSSVDKAAREIVVKVKEVFAEYVRQALLEDPVGNAYYNSWDEWKQKTYLKNPYFFLEIPETMRMRERVKKELKKRLPPIRVIDWLWVPLKFCQTESLRALFNSCQNSLKALQE